MNWTTFISSFIGSGVAVALIGAFVALQIAERKIAIENVTRERTKWREKIRGLSGQVQEASENKDSSTLERLRLEFALSLNPQYDGDDDILACIDKLASEGDNEKNLKEFTRRVALLLKHDWDRAKWEAKPVWCRPPRPPHQKNYAYSEKNSS